MKNPFLSLLILSASLLSAPAFSMDTVEDKKPLTLSPKKTDIMLEVQYNNKVGGFLGNEKLDPALYNRLQIQLNYHEPNPEKAAKIYERFCEEFPECTKDVRPNVFTLAFFDVIAEERFVQTHNLRMLKNYSIDYKEDKWDMRDMDLRALPSEKIFHPKEFEALSPEIRESITKGLRGGPYAKETFEPWGEIRQIGFVSLSIPYLEGMNINNFCIGMSHPCRPTTHSSFPTNLLVENYSRGSLESRSTLKMLIETKFWTHKVPMWGQTSVKFVPIPQKLGQF